MSSVEPPSSTPDVLPTGARVQWFLVRRVLGKGGFGITYDAWDTNLDRAVALKEYFPAGHAVRVGNAAVKPAHLDSEGVYHWGLERFIEEGRTLARLEHPSVVRVASVFRGNETAYLVMERLRGPSLGQLARGEPLAETQVLWLLHALMDGLEHVHDAGFIHRDIKPENVLLRADGNPVLVDFGSARRSFGDPGRLTSLITRGFTPIEQYRMNGSPGQGPWSDIYSLAATFHCVLTGRAPPDSLVRAAALAGNAADPMLPVGRTARREYSEAMLSVLDQGLAVQPGDRPQCVAEWRALFPPPPERVPEFPVLVLDDTTAERPRFPETEVLGTRESAAGTDQSPAAPSVPSQTSTLALRALAAPSLRQLHVLVLDDDPMAVNFMRRMLNALGVGHVTTEAHPAAALEQMAHSPLPTDVLICDLGMSEMDGLSFLRELADRRLPVAVVLLSSIDARTLESVQSLSRGYGLEVLGVLSKPVQPHALAEVLNRRDEAPTRIALLPDHAPDEEELRTGLRDGSLELVYQPQVRVSDRALLGMEALARFRHPQHGVLGAGTFIPAAEDAGLAQELTLAVLHQALFDAGAWRVNGADVGVSVNFLLSALHHEELPEMATAMARAEGVDITRVMFEIAQGRMFGDMTRVLETMSRLRLRGIRLAVDDFGRGQWSLEQLRGIPCEEIKLNASLVKESLVNSSARAVMEVACTLGHKLGMRVVAVGVETPTEWQLAAALGVDAIQGFLVAHPMPANVVPYWQETWQQGEYQVPLP